VTLEERHLRLPNIGRVRLKETCRERGFAGRILSATVRRRADRWFVSLAVERERDIVLPKPVVKAADVVGVDLGLKSAAGIHDGSDTRVVEPQRLSARASLSSGGSIVSSHASRRGRGTARKRSCGGRACTTRSPASGRTTSISSVHHWRKPSR
jgi:hypothetical protein